MSTIISSIYNSNDITSTVTSGLSSAKSAFSQCINKIQTALYEQSIFFALNNQAIAEKRNQYKNLNGIQKIQLGLIHGIETFAVGTFIVVGLDFALYALPTGVAATSSASITIPMVLIAAAIEELLFRGLFQTMLIDVQKKVTSITPNSVQNTRVFIWLTSPSARIIMVNSVFAALHLNNAGGYLSLRNAILQVTRLMLNPSFGILRETTDSVIAPMASHMTNNFLTIFLYRLFG